ncbi:MAG: NAD(P)-dependent oxidoreductase [Alphaproteobacteria bacterium]|nr:NAD(P)-dependent oxidoreductase [Alphaproteobacteria bacterium]
MNVLVTGGAGYIGSRLVADLVGAGAAVHAFDRLLYGGEALLPFFGNPQFRFTAGDIRDQAAIGAALAGADAVVHLAAVVGEQACAIDEESAAAINRDAALALLRAAEAKGVRRFVFISTCSNYGISDPQSLADETAALKPQSLYARTKVEVEKACLVHDGRMAVTVLRFGTICGLSARMRFDLLINEMAAAAASGRRIEIYKPAAWRPFLHVADAARAVRHVLGADRELVARRVFNVVGENHQKRDLLALALRHYPDTPSAISDARPDNRDYRVSAALIERTLGFKPAHSIEEAFVETAEAVRAGVFHDSAWHGHSALPLPDRIGLLRANGIG